MAATHSSGPDVIYGVPYDSNANSAGSNPDAGPSVTYQGDCVLDVRFPYQPGITGQGRVPAFLDSPYIVMVDAIPTAAGTLVVSNATATSGTPLPLLAVSVLNNLVNVPLLPFGAGLSSVVTGLGLDMGFATVTTTAGSSVAVLSAPNNIAVVGQNVLVQQGTTFIGATIAAVAADGVTLTLSAAMTVTGAGKYILAGNGSGQRNVVPSYFTPYLLAGAALVFDATEALARGLAVTSNNAADTGWTVKVSGYDLYGVPMSETIAVTAGGTAYGRKAFKFVTSAVPTKSAGAVSTGVMSVSTSDVIGFSMRSDKWEYLNCYWAGAFLTVSNGWLAADPTNPATSTTGDVRGTLQLSAAGQSGTYATGGASNNVRRLAVFQTLASAALTAATPQNPAPLFGVTQA